MNERLQGGGHAAFRGLLSLCLLGLVGWRLSGGERSVGLIVHLIVIPLWFAPTLWLSLVRPVCGRTLVLRNTLFAVMDTNLAMMAVAALASAWLRPYDLLGAQVFVVAILCGPAVGAASALSGFIGFVNGWLVPDALTPGNLLAGGGTAVAGAICGAAWRHSVPQLIRALRRPAPVVNPVAAAEARLADMELRLQAIADERDRAQERLHELETERALGAGRSPAPAAGGVGNSDSATAAGTEGATLPEDPLARIRELEAEVAHYREERKASIAEKRRLMTEISDLSKDLMAAHSPAREGGRAAGPGQGGAAPGGDQREDRVSRPVEREGAAA